MALKIGSWHPTPGNILGGIIGLATAVVTYGQYIPGKVAAGAVIIATAILTVSKSLIPHADPNSPTGVDTAH
jgi:hypothetical protein